VVVYTYTHRREAGSDKIRHESVIKTVSSSPGHGERETENPDGLHRERGCAQLATAHNYDPVAQKEKPITEVVLSGEFETHPPLICVSTKL
jgi:hypothetical protein